MIHRRGFLATAAAAFGAPRQSIIDTHVHFYDPTRPQGVPWPAKSESVLYKPMLPKTYRELVEPMGVKGAIVIEASPWREDNQWVLDLAKDNPIIVALVGHLEPGSANFRSDLQRFAKNPLFRGIRVGGGKFVEDDMRALADADLSLDAIGNATILPSLLALTDRVPNLRIIVNHLPVEPSGWQSDSGMQELAKRPQVYAKVSWVLKPDTPALDRVWSLFGPDRVVYGSNWPVSDKFLPYPVVLKLMQDYLAKHSEADRRKYFWENSKACYKWIARG